MSVVKNVRKLSEEHAVLAQSLDTERNPIAYLRAVRTERALSAVAALLEVLDDDDGHSPMQGGCCKCELLYEINQATQYAGKDAADETEELSA